MVLVLILALVLLLGACVLFPVLRYSAYTDKTPALRLSKPSIIGHRGAGGFAPENTLRGLREGMEYADVLEIDVHPSRDGQVVVMHDRSEDRTTNGKGEIIELAWDFIRTLDAGTWFGTAYAGEPVVNEPEDLRKVLNLGVDAVITGYRTDFTQRCMQCLKKSLL